MIGERAAEKVTANHLARDAYLYVRQSTLRQVMENTTSTDRQYGLRQRAVALGWAADQVKVIEEDLGRSGASSEGRAGFARLVADVGMGKAGIVIGTEVSRLARNNADWHRLLEICALSETLILDEDGLYDPGAFNDRLLLGMKGQMSEAELHLLKARLRGGQLTKARRGELIVPLPVGLLYDAAGAGGARSRPSRARRGDASLRRLLPQRLGPGHGQGARRRGTAFPLPGAQRAHQRKALVTFPWVV